MHNGGTKKNKTTSPKTREGKASVYEGGHRVPGIVWAPGRVTPGTSSELVVSMDIMPTSLTMANVDVPEGHRFDGLDVGPSSGGGASALRFAVGRGSWFSIRSERRSTSSITWTRIPGKSGIFPSHIPSVFNSWLVNSTRSTRRPSANPPMSSSRCLEAKKSEYSVLLPDCDSGGVSGGRHCGPGCF